MKSTQKELGENKEHINDWEDRIVEIKSYQHLQYSGPRKWSKEKRHKSYFKIYLTWRRKWIRSDQISRSVVSDSLRPHEPQHARPPCPSPTLGVHSDSRPSSQWCHPAISYSVVPFSSCPQSLPALEPFPMSQVDKVLEFKFQHQFFQWTPRTDLL